MSSGAPSVLLRKLTQASIGPAIAGSGGVLLAAMGILGLLHWSTASADALSRERQHRLIGNVLKQSAAQVAHQQESVTVWDESIEQLHTSPLDLEWLDNNLGIWLHSYYGHDETYVLSRSDEPLYSVQGGRRGKPEDFHRLGSGVQELVGELRDVARSSTSADLPADQLSPTVTDLLVVDGHPSIVSVKPVVSDTGDIEQEPGAEFVHVAVRRLDGSFVDEIRHAYELAGARFTTTADFSRNESAQPLHSRSGRLIGYFVWRPFTPGALVFGWLAPVLIFAALLLAAVLFVLIRRIARRTFELRESNAAVQHLAFHDALTGLPNRALFENRLAQALTVFCTTADHRLALLYLDLDRFKMVNDTLGHAAGDELIRQFAARLSGVTRAADTAARLGGDEFAVLQNGIESLEDVERLCCRIIDVASDPFEIEGSRVHVGVSIGVALAGKDGLDPEELTRRADIALYEVKSSGRGQFMLFAPAMDEPIRARRNAEKDLRAALEAGDQLSVVYQPTYSASDHRIVGAEALIRWRHPESGNVSPAVFIPVAEEIGLIEPLGEWVLRQACRDGRNWPIDTLSINVSPVQLRNPHFATRAIQIIGEEQIPPDRIEFEITETAVLGEERQCATNLRLLRAFGVRIALDDFGTGYSSFSHFNKFEVDRVKIDRTFVGKIDGSEGGSAIIQAIVDLARSSGFRTTAEGVETDEQRMFLEGIGCDDLQGFLLAHPASASEIDDLLGTAAASQVVAPTFEAGRSQSAAG